VETIKRKIPALLISFILVISISLMIPGVLTAQDEEAEEEIQPEELLLETTLPKIQADEGELFTFDFDVTYLMGDDPYGISTDETKKTFDVTVDYPDGWDAAVGSGQTEVRAINLTRYEKESLKLFAAELISQEPGEYIFKANFKSSIEGDPLEGSIEFTAVITASYEIEITTKSGMLSTDITSGKDNHYKLVINNNSSTSLENIKLTSTEPEGWNVSFDTDEIESIEAGENAEVDVTINPHEKTIAGDYMLTFTASNDKASDDVELRVTVETPTIWGIVGIGIIVIVIVGVAIIFTRLGRR
jgi:uncharacterized membrane protein